MIDLLVTRPYGVGNTVQAIPALRMLIDRHKEFTVWVGDAAAKELLIASSLGNGPCPKIELASDATDRDCDTWISLWPWDSAVQPNNYKRRFGYIDADADALVHRYGEKLWSKNEVQANAEIVSEYLDLKEDWTLPACQLWYMGGPGPQDVIKNRVGIHPGCQGGDGGVWKRKRWPVDSWLLLIDKLRAAGKEIRIFGTTGSDSDVLSALLRTYDASMGQVTNVFWCIDRKPSEAAWEAGKCGAGFVSNDSGMAHIAVAGYCPKVVTLYGPTRPNKNTHDQMAPVVGYGRCNYQPCYSDHFSAAGLRCTVNDCMRGISVERVLRELAI